MRVEDVLDAAHERADGGVERFAQVGLLGVADAMLAGDLSAQFVCLCVEFFEDGRERPLPGVFGEVVAQGVDVEVAVAGVAEGADADAVLLLERVREEHELGHVAARHDDVAFVHFRRGGLDRLEEGAARGPDRFVALLRRGDGGCRPPA